jgi:hypothetical protein
VKREKPHYVKAKILNGYAKGIPVIVKNVSHDFRQLQFPFHLTSAMYLNNAQREVPSNYRCSSGD